MPLFAALLMVSGCQQSDLPQLPPWLGGTKPPAQADVAPPPPSVPAVRSPAAPVAPPVVRSPLAEAPPPEAAPLPTPTPALQAPAPVPPAPTPVQTAQAARQAHAGEVRAALLLPLTGQYQALGQSLSNAAQLALFEIADTRFSLIPLDTKGSAEGAAAAAQQALAQGADIILGPVFSSEVKAAAPLAREQAVPMLSFTTDRTAAGDGIYALGFLPGPQVKRVIALAQSQGRQRFAVLAPNNDYGRAVVEAAKQALAALSLPLVKVDYYDPAAPEVTGAVKRFADFDSRARALAREKAALASRQDAVSMAALKKLDNAQTFGEIGFDAVLIPEEGTKLRNIASLLTYYDVDAERVKLLGTLLWNDALAAEPALWGGWYPAPATASHTEFEKRYTDAFGAIPPRVGSLAGLAYDATALAAALARQGLGNYPPSALQNPNGFAGVDGIFRLLPDGTAERGLAVREIVKGGSREVSEAPATFQ